MRLLQNISLANAEPIKQPMWIRHLLLGRPRAVRAACASSAALRQAFNELEADDAEQLKVVDELLEAELERKFRHFQNQDATSFIGNSSAISSLFTRNPAPQISQNSDITLRVADGILVELRRSESDAHALSLPFFSACMKRSVTSVQRKGKPVSFSEERRIAVALGKLESSKQHLSIELLDWAKAITLPKGKPPPKPSVANALNVSLSVQASFEGIDIRIDAEQNSIRLTASDLFAMHSQFRGDSESKHHQAASEEEEDRTRRSSVLKLRRIELRLKTASDSARLEIVSPLLSLGELHSGAAKRNVLFTADKIVL
jgi:hypothetical protein